MVERGERIGWRPSLAKRFMLGSFVILLVGGAGIGAWVARRIESGVVHRTAATTALYVDSLIAPSLQGLGTGALRAEDRDRLDWLLADTPLGQEIADVRVWDREGEIVYSTMPALVGQRFPVEGDLAAALAGRVSAEIGAPEGEVERPAGVPSGGLLEIYSPVRSRDAGGVIGAAEFYYGTEDLRRDVAAAQRRSWLVVGGATLAIYLLLAAFVQRASDTIARQQRALGAQVARLTELLGQNEDLHRRVRGAAARTTALNERFLRRFSAELHDGPAQDISLALLHLDHVAERCAADGLGPAERAAQARDLDLIQGSLRRALDEVRATSSGLLLPRLGDLTLPQVVERVTRDHRRRTGSALTIELGDLPEEAPLATKIAVYRVVQEALANAWRHAGAAGQALRVGRVDGRLRVEVSDRGPGFDATTIGASEERLGLVGMRERVESLGGEFGIESEPGRGTRVVAVLPVEPGGDGDG